MNVGSVFYGLLRIFEDCKNLMLTADAGNLAWFKFMVFNTTFNNISVISLRSVLLMEETGVPGESHRPVASHRQTLSHNADGNLKMLTCSKQ